MTLTGEDHKSAARKSNKVCALAAGAVNTGVKRMSYSGLTLPLTEMNHNRYLG